MMALSGVFYNNDSWTQVKDRRAGTVWGVL